MAVRCLFRDVLAEDIVYIALNMRTADVAELKAAHGDDCDIGALLSRSVDNSTLVRTTVDALTGEPVAIFGVAPASLLGATGIPWMLGTEKMFDYPRELWRDGRRWVGEMLVLFSHLANFVDARNEASIKWLKRFGFTVEAPQPYGVTGLPFCRFEKKLRMRRIKNLNASTTSTKKAAVRPPIIP